MKSKLLNLLLIITSLFGYFEWGQNNSSFLFQAEYDIILTLLTNIKSVIHPFILIPLFGQIVLIFAMIQKRPNRILTYTGIVCLGLLLGLMFFIGIFSFNLKILGSTLPFFLTVIMVIRNFRRQRPVNNPFVE